MIAGRGIWPDTLYMDTAATRDYEALALQCARQIEALGNDSGANLVYYNIDQARQGKLPMSQAFILASGQLELTRAYTD